MYDHTVERLVTHGRLPDEAPLDPRWDGKGGLDGFLNTYFRVQKVLAHIPRPQLFDAVMQQAEKQGIVYVEVLTSLRTLRPNWQQLATADESHDQKHQADDPLELAQAVAPTLVEMRDAARRHRTHVGVLCALGPRHGPDHMRSVLRAAKLLRNQGLPVVGVGISGEYTDFAPINRMLHQEGLDGLLWVPHAGELPQEPNLQAALEGDPPLPSRIAHGIEAQANPDLARLLSKHNICCDIAPTSNEMLGACSPGRHPVVDMIRAGIPCTISPDDSLLFGTDVCDEYERVQQMGATPQELVGLARNSIIHAGADHRLRRKWLADLDSWGSQHLGQVPLVELLQQQTNAEEHTGEVHRCGSPRTTDGKPCMHLVRPGQRCPDHRVA